MGKLYSYLITVASAMGGFLFGYEVGIIGQVLHMDDYGTTFGLKQVQKYIFVKDRTNVSDTNYTTLIATDDNAEISGWITSSLLLGGVLGAASSAFLTDYIGRRFSILVGAVLFLAGGALQTGAGNLAALYPGRVISGTGVGLLSAAVPLYIAETAPTATRGRLTSVYQLMVMFGILVSASVNAAIFSTLTGEMEWRLAVGLQMIPALILLLLICGLPFSPRWLISKKRDAEALAVLADLQDAPESSPKVQEEYAAIRADYDVERVDEAVSYFQLLQKGVRNRLFIGVMLQFFQQWTGVNVITYYAVGLFGDMGFKNLHTSVAFVVVNAAINFVATFPGMWLVERPKFGRTRLLIIGGVLMGLSHCLICLLTGLSHYRMDPKLSWGAVVFIYTFTISYAATWGPVVWVYQSEIFPIKSRAKGTAICSLTNWVWNAIIAKIAPIFLDQIGFYTYLIFGGMGFLMTIFVMIFVPETRGKSMEEMDKVFDRFLPGRKEYTRWFDLRRRVKQLRSNTIYQRDNQTPKSPAIGNYLPDSIPISSKSLDGPGKNFHDHAVPPA